MTHRESIAALLASPSDDGPESAAAKQAALDHIASCHDCWRIVREIHELTPGASLEDAARITELFGCEQAGEHLFELVGFSSNEIAQRFPDLARHLAGCQSCSEHLNDLRSFSVDLATGDVPTLASALAWRASSDASGRAVWRLLGTVRARIRRGVAYLAELPEICAPLSPMLIEPVRGDGPRSPSPASVLQGFCVDIADSGMRAEVSVRSYDETHVALQVSLSRDAGDDYRGVLRLSALGPKGKELVAAETIRTGAPVVVQAVPFGEYVLEISDATSSVVHEIPLSVGPES